MHRHQLSEKPGSARRNGFHHCDLQLQKRRQLHQNADRVYEHRKISSGAYHQGNSKVTVHQLLNRLGLETSPCERCGDVSFFFVSNCQTHSPGSSRVRNMFEASGWLKWKGLLVVPNKLAESRQNILVCRILIAKIFVG